MKRILSLVLCLGMLFSATASAQVNITAHFKGTYTDGKVYDFFYGTFEGVEEEVGLQVGKNYYPLTPEKFALAKTLGNKFGIGLYDPDNVANGNEYIVYPYWQIAGEKIKSPTQSFTVKPEVITDIRYTGPASTEDPIFDTAPVLIENFKNGAQLYTNVPVLKCDNLMSQYSGNPVISLFNPIAGTTPSDLKSAWYGSKGYKWLNFTIHKSATIRVFSEGAITPLQNAGYGYGYTEETTAENGGFYFSRLNSDWPNADRSKMDRMYTKHFEVPPGEPQTVQLPNAQNMSSNKWGYVVMIDFDEPLTPVIQPEITNITYKGPTDSSFDTSIVSGTLENGVPMYTNYTTVSAENISDELIGLPYLYTANPIARNAPQTIKDAWGNKLISWYTFDINKSATVCIYTDGAALDYGKDGYNKETSSTPYFQKKNNDSYTNMATRYVKHFDVPEGETVTVSIPNTPHFGTTKWGHLVTVQFDQ